MGIYPGKRVMNHSLPMGQTILFSSLCVCVCVCVGEENRVKAGFFLRPLLFFH